MALRVTSIGTTDGTSVSFSSGLTIPDGVELNATEGIFVNAPTGVVTCSQLNANVNVSGIVTATTFYGDGSRVTIPNTANKTVSLALTKFL
jgi:hypothetical protein